MRKLLVLLSIVLLVCSGCQGKFKDYSENEKERLEALGRSQLLDILEEEAIVSIEAYVNQPISGKVELTEYVFGQYQENNEIYDYYLNTNTNEFFTSKEFKLLEDEITASLIEGLKLGEDVCLEWMKVAPYLLPNEVVEDIRPENDSLQVYFEKVLPIGYVENRKKSNQEVVHQVMASMYVSDAISLEHYDLGSFDLEGIDVLYLSIENSYEQLIYRKDDYTWNHPIIPKVEYTRFEAFDNNGYTLRGSTYRRILTIDEEGNEIEQQEEYAIDDFTISTSENGFEVGLPDSLLKGKYNVVCADLNREGTTYDQKRLSFVKRADGRLWLQGEERLYLPNYYRDTHDYTIDVFGYTSEHSFTLD